MNDILFAVIGYLAGSIPFGLLLTRAAGIGQCALPWTGNIGATNVLRTGNKKIAALTLICDGLKGYFPVLAASLWGGEFAPLFAGFGALAGHILPGVAEIQEAARVLATGIGVLFGWAPDSGSRVHRCLGFATFFITRISSASALTAALLAVPASFVLAKTMGGNTMMAV